MIIVYNLREIAEKCNIDKIYKGRILFDEPVAPRTTFKVGGNAPVLFEPSDVKSLCCILSLLKKNAVPFFVLGGGSNIVVSSKGFDGAVIATCALNSITLNESDGVVTAQAGASMQQLVNFCTKNCLSGIEPFAGLPGTVGGAAFMNARCFDLSLSDVFVSAQYVQNVGNEYNVLDCQFNSADWDYKKSPFAEGGKIITSVSFRLKKNPESEGLVIRKKCSAFIKQRLEKGHFKYPCAGSVFKNNPAFGAPTGKIIDELGLKGFEMGGAQIAPWHGNIIINKGHASPEDIKNLTDYIIKKVFEAKGIRLESEIIFCGK